MNAPLHLFEAYGVELEYMLVRQEDLNISPTVDRIFHSASGSYVSDHTEGDVTWSNELVRHVMEIKVSEPVPSLDGLDQVFGSSIATINRLAAASGECLLPTGMHPWMNPLEETRLWPHESAEIYQAFHRVFNCYRHGWANLQSVHVNLPFAGDDEFSRLHAAIRMVLPLIPALAASSPLMDGCVTGLMDTRLDVYSGNSAHIPEIAGQVIPEPVHSREEYHDVIFKPMFRAIAPHDKDGILNNEFLNARGAIARFDRSAIEIRLIDVQECPAADLAVVTAVVHAVKRMVEQLPAASKTSAAWPVARLRSILDDCIRDAESAVLHDADYLRAWGMDGVDSATAGQLWCHIVRDIPGGVPPALDHILRHGTLARRIIRALPPAPPRDAIRLVYRQLAGCLADGHVFGS